MPGKARKFSTVGLLLHKSRESRSIDLPLSRRCPYIRARIRLVLPLAAILSIVAASRVFAAGPPAQPINYVLNLRNTSSHEVAVTMTVPQALPSTEIQFPAWNALYQIRDFVRGVEHLAAMCDGRSERMKRMDLNTWQTAPEPCAKLEVQYHVLIDDEGIFASVLNQDHCYTNLAMLLFYLPKERDREVQVQFLLPDGWQLRTFLDDGAVPGTFSAANFDALVDSPVEAAPAAKSGREGQFHEYSYEQKGATYRVVVYGNPADYDPESLLDGLSRITATATSLMRDVPFSRYTFIFHFPRGPGGGGMEHRNGTAISVSAEGLRSNLIGLESVAAHEFFHAWNVKRIRPQNLEPVDYVHGNDTEDLWFSEGVTSTYGELTLLRSGLISRQDFYQRLADEIRRLQGYPARLSQSLEESGREAWLEKYPDYRRPERSISYYNKGELLGFLLDLAIRHSTDNQQSLDDVMRRLNTDFAKRNRFFTQADLRNTIAQLAPSFAGLDQFFQDYLAGTKELDFDTYLGYAGLQLLSAEVERGALGFSPTVRPDGAVVVQSVESGSEIKRSGLRKGDFVLQMDGRKLGDLEREEFAQIKPGQKFELTVRRDTQVLKFKATAGTRMDTEYRIMEIPNAAPEQLKVRNGWLEGTESSASGN